jgi:hypothetical protein
MNVDEAVKSQPEELKIQSDKKHKDISEGKVTSGNKFFSKMTKLSKNPIDRKILLNCKD